MSGQVLPHLRPWFETNLGVELDYKTPSQQIKDMDIPEPVECYDDIHGYLRQHDISFSNGPRIRLMRAHGHTVSRRGRGGTKRTGYRYTT